MIHCNPFQPARQPELVWSQLWPLHGTAYRGQGWSENLKPGLHLVLDDSGEEARRWLPLFAGAEVPAQGQVSCAGINSQAHRADYFSHVYWHNPRAGFVERDISAQSWLQGQAERWINWEEADCLRHCQGFGLLPFLRKPVWQLSTGSQRKLGLVAALSSGARLTLIEEPIAGLDSQSIRYLEQALDALAERQADGSLLPRWILVAHWESLAHVMWDEVLTFPSVANLGAGTNWQEGDGHRQHILQLE